MTQVDRATLGQWLSLAAAPSFALMALLSATGADGPAHSAGAHGEGLGGTVAMYLLMALFHLSPWLGRTEDTSQAD